MQNWRRGCFWLVFLLLGLNSRVTAQEAWKQIQQRGTLTIATDATYPPFEFKEKDQLVGFDIELGDALGKELRVKVVWLPLEWTAVQGSLESHKADLIMSGMTITEERKLKGYTFSRPYFLSRQVIAKRHDDPRIKGLADLRDKTVSVQDSTTGMTAVQKAGLPDTQIRKFDQLQDGLLDVKNYKSDAVVADVPALKHILPNGYTDLELTGESDFPPENLGIAAGRNEQELASQINSALDKLLANGTYSRIYEKWIVAPEIKLLIGQLNNAKKEGSSLQPTTSVSPLAIRWDILRESLPQLLQGAEITLEITVLTLLFGAVGGLIVALLRLSPIPPLRAAVIAYVELVRGTPLLMQIYFIYFVLPTLHVSLNPLMSGVVALSLNAAAYISEIFRAGIESIDAGQMEAARALGMDYPSAMRWIILPQTLRRVLPPLTNEAVALLKDSSLVSVVGVVELMRQGKEIAANTGSATTLYLGVAVCYLVMTLPLTALVRRLERQWQPISRV